MEQKQTDLHTQEQGAAELHDKRYCLLSSLYVWAGNIDRIASFRYDACWDLGAYLANIGLLLVHNSYAAVVR